MYTKETVREIARNYEQAKLDYDRMKNNVMREIKDFLRQTSQGFSASELSQKFGLPAKNIACSARFWYIKSRKTTKVRKFVELDENGAPVLDKIYSVRTKCNEYYDYST